MRIFLSVFVLLAAVLPMCGEVADVQVAAPKGELNEIEKKFVGKWKGERSVFRWEIHRKEDRTFEIAFAEPDPDDESIILRNYATGVWWVEDGDYKFAWNRWLGAEGDFSGLAVEKVKTVKEDKVVTLSEDDEDPNNVEVRVEKFEAKAWELKPEEE